MVVVEERAVSAAMRMRLRRGGRSLGCLVLLVSLRQRVRDKSHSHGARAHCRALQERTA
jgi:hypothetical protein